MDLLHSCTILLSNVRSIHLSFHRVTGGAFDWDAHDTGGDVGDCGTTTNRGNDQIQTDENGVSKHNRRERKPPKIMTREQFYKIRPKVPRISKTDRRRFYAAAFAEAYNSCDFDKIWEFVSTYCTKDVLFVHRWVGSELYLNFPKYLEIRGIESVVEYWFSRCMIVPDLVFELKETKLYVRSDGISTVLSSFSIVCTRLYDGEISDSIICRPAVDSESNDQNDEERAEQICNRVFDKLKQILLHHTANEKSNNNSQSAIESDSSSKKRKLASDDERIDLFANEDMKIIGVQAPVSSPDLLVVAPSPRKRMPKHTSITLQGTVTLHLNLDHKIRQVDLTFALQQ